MSEAVFIDTWGWLALGHRRDARHQEVKEYYQALQAEKTPLYTSDYVLDEVITLLFRREVFEEAVRFVEGIFKAAERSHLTIERVTSERFAAAWKLRQRFQDKPKISFTDLTSMIIMRERQKGFNGGRAFPASRNELPKGSLSLHVQTKCPRKHAGVHKRSEGKHTLASPGHRERPREFHEKIAIPPTVWQEALFPPECLEIYR